MNKAWIVYEDRRLHTYTSRRSQKRTYKLAAVNKINNPDNKKAKSKRSCRWARGATRKKQE